MASSSSSSSSCLLLLHLLLASSSSFPPCLSAHVYIVGGGKGWTLPSRAKLDYQKWVSTITPQIGDLLEFDYNQRAHSVLQVIRSDYRYCNASNPIAIFQDGRTIIKLTRTGSYYFICGVPGHCEAGQKFMMRLANTTAAAAAPLASPSPLDQPALAPAAQSLPPFRHAVPSTISAADGVRSSIMAMVSAVVLGFTIYFMGV